MRVIVNGIVKINHALQEATRRAKEIFIETAWWNDVDKLQREYDRAHCLDKQTFYQALQTNTHMNSRYKHANPRSSQNQHFVYEISDLFECVGLKRLMEGRRAQVIRKDNCNVPETG